MGVIMIAIRIWDLKILINLQVYYVMVINLEYVLIYSVYTRPNIHLSAAATAAAATGDTPGHDIRPFYTNPPNTAGAAAIRPRSGELPQTVGGAE